MKQEVDSIMQPSALPFDWRLQYAIAGNQRDSQLHSSQSKRRTRVDNGPRHRPGSRTRDLPHVLLRTTHPSGAGPARIWLTPPGLQSARMVFDSSISEELRKTHEGRRRPLLTGNRQCAHSEVRIVSHASRGNVRALETHSTLNRAGFTEEWASKPVRFKRVLQTALRSPGVAATPLRRPAVPLSFDILRILRGLA